MDVLSQSQQMYTTYTTQKDAREQKYIKINVGASVYNTLKGVHWSLLSDIVIILNLNPESDSPHLSFPFWKSEDMIFNLLSIVLF